MPKPDDREDFRQTLEALRFYQQRARLARNSLRANRAKCHELGQRLRRLRPRLRTPVYLADGMQPLHRIQP